MIRPKERDPRFSTVRRGGALQHADHHLLASQGLLHPDGYTGTTMLLVGLRVALITGWECSQRDVL